MRVTDGHGVMLELDGVKLCLDGGALSDLTFLSHAHTDHLIKKPVSQPVISSRLTKDLCYARTGLRIKENLINDEFKGLKLSMIDNGHIAGSKALLVEGSERVLYTSDYCLNERFFIKGFNPPKADVLIMETTYGSHEYKFPQPKDVISEAGSDIKALIESGGSAVLLGYALGKAQLITKLVEGFDNVYAHKSIIDMNRVISSHYSLPELLKLELRRLPKQFIALCPAFGPTNPVIKGLRERGAKIFTFTGWAGHRSLSVDKAYELSDHPDFKDLLVTVKKVNPRAVYTHHGYAQEFAEILNADGIEAHALN